jgi:tetratricopeptide (TPR) repeat protein
MDEIQVYALIADGESTNVEFKRELDLSIANTKAEFIKDVIALANSAIDAGYMLIGVDNYKMIVGSNGVKEEQIQQILSTYTTPPVNATYESIPMHSVGFVQVEVLTIRPTQKPHSVARSVGNRTQNEVFVRHGTVVTDASPDEIIAMRDSSRVLLDSRQYIRAAETHERLGYLDMAVNAYSKAIELTPTAELFLARGNVYERLSHEAADLDKCYDMEEKAFRDYSDAVKLATTSEIRKTARLRRWHFNASLIPKEEYALERDWITSNTSGLELGKVLFSELRAFAESEGLWEKEDAVAILNQIVELGYKESEVYALRADAHYLDCNFRLALEDINRAISAPRNTQTHAEYLMLRASILIRMVSARDHSHRNFMEAYYDILRAYKMNGRTNGYKLNDFEDDIFFKAIVDFTLETAHEFQYAWFRPELRVQFIQELVRVMPTIDHLATKDPSMSKMLKRLLGDAFWQEHRSKLE